MEFIQSSIIKSRLSFTPNQRWLFEAAQIPDKDEFRQMDDQRDEMDAADAFMSGNRIISLK